MSEQTWTDEQLQAYLAAMDKLIADGSNPKSSLYAMPGRFPWCEIRYILRHEDETIVLTLTQAYQVEVWSQQHFPLPEKPKHDGKLDKVKDSPRGFVEHMDNVGDDLSKPRAGIHIHDDYADFESNCIYLDAKQALSLLAWLRQEERALERLAEEQAK